MGQVLIFAFIHAYFYSSENRGGSVPLLDSILDMSDITAFQNVKQSLSDARLSDEEELQPQGPVQYSLS
jgi:hypothetical protein